MNKKGFPKDIAVVITIPLVVILIGILTGIIVPTFNRGSIPDQTAEEATKTNLSEEAVVEIALPHINRDFPGSSSNKNEYVAYFENGIWMVTPKLPEGMLGGGASAEVSDKTGTVLKTLFTE